MDLQDMFFQVWDYRFPLAPVLMTYLLFDLPAIARRITGVAYVPVYFIFFPSGHSDQLYAQYFNEDYMYLVGAQQTTAQKRELRRKIQATAILSALFAAIIAPWTCGFLSAFYLNTPQFDAFLWFLLTAKAILLYWTLAKLKNDSNAFSDTKYFAYVAFLYIGYLVLVWQGITKSYHWTHMYLQSNGLVGLLIGLLDYAYIDIFLNIVAVSAVTWGLTTLITDPSRIPRDDGDGHE